MAELTIGACQTPDFQDDLPAALAVIREHAATAVGVDLLCFPEAFLTGYTRSAAVADRRALTLTEATFGSVLDALSDCRPSVLLGLFEHSGGELFNSAVLVTRGAVSGVYRKRHPLEEGVRAGTELGIFEFGGARLGVGICSDARDVADAARLAQAGVDAIVYPLNNMLATAVAGAWRERHMAILADRARQTGAWVISADVVGCGTGLIGYGCSAIVDPAGSVVARVGESAPGMVSARVPVRGRVG